MTGTSQLDQLLASKQRCSRGLSALLIVLLYTTSLAADTVVDDGCAKFEEIYAALRVPVDYWKTRGGIQRKDVDKCRLDPRIVDCTKCAHRLMVYGNRLYFNRGSMGGNMHARYEASLMQMLEALRHAHEPVPNIEFEFSPQDFPPRHCAAVAFVSPANLSADPKYDTPAFIFPDWGFVAWPEIKTYPPWQQLVWQIDEVEAAVPWAAKDQRLLWRGTVQTNPVRQKLLDLAAKLPPERSDVSGLEVGWYFLKNLTHNPHLGPPDWCRYRYIANTEGHSWSVRLNHMVLCRSAILSHDLQWHALVPALMTPGVDYIATGPGFERLLPTLRGLWDAPGAAAMQAAAAAAAAARAARFRRLLTPAGLGCYIRQLFRSYASVQAFSVEPTAEALKAEWMDVEYWVYKQIKASHYRIDKGGGLDN